MYMFKYVMKRIGLMLMTFCIIWVMCFVLIKMLPLVIDTETVARRYEAQGWIKNVQMLENGNIGYDKVPLLTQLGTYFKKVFFEGNFGGITNGQKFGTAGAPVWDIFVIRLPPTILINIYSTIIGVPIGLVLGIIAALKKNKWQDQVINVFIILLISLPGIVLGILIQLIYWKLCGKTTMMPGTDYFSWPMFKSMLPAVFSLCLGSIAGYARYTRAELSEVLTSEFMLLARTKGLTKGQAVLRHAMRNSMVVIFPSILSEFISVLSGSLIIEQIFVIPGVGALYLGSIVTQDYNLFMLLSAFYTFIGLAAGIVIDISYGFIDPRIRMGAK